MILKNLIYRIIFVLNIFFLLAIGFSYLALVVSPEKIWVTAFFGLAFPVLLIGNLFFFFFWIIFRWRLALFSGIMIAIGFPKIGGFFQWRTLPDANQIEKIKSRDSTLKILSYNVRLFDLYNWSNNKLTRNKILRLIQDENADIICLQEFFYEDSGKFKTLDTLVDIQKAKFYHIEHTAHVKKVNHWGIATFSRFPIISKGLIKFPDSTDNVSMYTDLSVNGDTIRVYNLHLESIRFREKEYEAIKEMADNDYKPRSENIRMILKRLRRAFIRRARQTDVIARHIALSPHPVIVCGDFNDTPNSYAYHQIARGLSDAFLESGSGRGSTYAGLIPLLRIDYLLYSDEYFESIFFKTERKKYSDHYPVSGIFKILKNK